MATEQENRELARETDRQLVSRFVAGADESAFREIVRRHGPLVLGVCRRVLGEVHEAEDAFQATFLVLARDARKIRRRKSLSSWLHGVAYRISARVVKRKFRHMEPLHDEQAEDRSALLEHIARRHDQRMVDEELNNLPERDRESLTLRYLEDRSNSEIAITLEISVSAVEGRIKRAKDRLRRQLLRRGISLSLFLGVLAESSIEARALESLIPETVELGLLDAAGELTDSSAAHELAVTEMGEMAMNVKQAVSIAAATLLTVGLGMYGLSEYVVGQESAGTIAVPGAAAETADVEIETAAVLSEPVAAKPSAGKRVARGSTASTRLKAAQAISAALEDEVLMEFADAPLSEVVDYLQTSQQIPIVMDVQALGDVGLAVDTPITCSFNGITLRSALPLVLDPLDLDYVIRNEVLMITTKEVARTQLDPRVHSVDGLQMDAEKLIELITAMVAPDTWEESGGNGKISSLDGPRPSLVIAQTDQIHDQIGDFLEKLRQATSE